MNGERLLVPGAGPPCRCLGSLSLDSAKEDPFLRCGCGAIGLATIEPEADRLHVAEEVLGMSRRLWVDQAWGLEKVEWRIVEG
ncbi:MAG: hypothetical protein V3R69_00795 [candidate division NC10 bacterium]